MPHFCLTIAGSDPTSGAGIQADIRTFDRIGVHPFSVITALTYQSASKFYGFKSLSDDLESQLKALFDNYPIKYVKVGMIPDSKTIEIITNYIKKFDLCVVLDPVSISSAGKRLSSEGMEKLIESKLFPLVSVLTPNVREAELYANADLSQMELKDVEKVKLCAETLILKLYSSKFHHSHEKAVIIKSAGLENDIIFDLLCLVENRDSKPRFHIFKIPKLDLGANVHGTGCVFSSAITAYLAKEYKLFDAIKAAETFFNQIFQKYIELPDRGNVLNLSLSEDHISVIEQIKEIFSYLRSNRRYSKLIPEVRMNISGALPNATEKKDVAAIEGRITVLDGYPYASGDIKFGVSDHTARLILEAKKFDPSVNFVVNLKYKFEWINAIKNSTNLELKEIVREDQPENVKLHEKSTMQWLIQRSIKEIGRIPDIIWDRGSIGKEPMIRLFGKNSEDIILKLKQIIKSIN